LLRISNIIDINNEAMFLKSTNLLQIRLQTEKPIGRMQTCSHEQEPVSVDNAQKTVNGLREVRGDVEEMSFGHCGENVVETVMEKRFSSSQV
jgi:hypothetical protein